MAVRKIYVHAEKSFWSMNDTEDGKILASFDVFGTANQTEMIAMLKTLTYIKENYPDQLVEVAGDMKFIIPGFKSWIPKCKANNWCKKNNKTVKNKELLIQIDDLMEEIGRDNLSIILIDVSEGSRFYKLDTMKIDDKSINVIVDSQEVVFNIYNHKKVNGTYEIDFH